jgi:broad specificity phosphatase PhoE
MIQALFIRHGQSTANVGIFSPHFAEVPLTKLGEQQAEALATTWKAAPDRIAVSPYLRAQQTAAPTLARFPEVPVETWPIHEFTYWAPEYWHNTDPQDYPEERARFWRVADPEYKQGEAAESFAEFLQRARDTLQKLQSQPDGATVMLFSHGHFIQAVRFEILFPEWTDKQKMEHFHAYDEVNRIKNTQCLWGSYDGRGWTIDGPSNMA